jgi:hypothetical protein
MARSGSRLSNSLDDAEEAHSRHTQYYHLRHFISHHTLRGRRGLTQLHRRLNIDEARYTIPGSSPNYRVSY